MGTPSNREWLVQRRTDAKGWTVTHRPTRITFTATSKARARHDITSGHYTRQIGDALTPKTAGRRYWHTDPITGVAHLYTGPLFSWHCDVHNQVCDPFRRITTNDILTLAARDEHLDDDTFVLLSQVLDGRTADTEVPTA